MTKRRMLLASAGLDIGGGIANLAGSTLHVLEGAVQAGVIGGLDVLVLHGSAPTSRWIERSITSRSRKGVFLRHFAEMATRKAVRPDPFRQPWGCASDNAAATAIPSALSRLRPWTGTGPPLATSSVATLGIRAGCRHCFADLSQEDSRYLRVNASTSHPSDPAVRCPRPNRYLGTANPAFNDTEAADGIECWTNDWQ
jgi:hypothetical protein